MVRYYDGLEVRAEDEVDAERAAELETHVVAYFDGGDRLERAELHDQGRIVRVDYPAGGDDVARRHRERYGDVPLNVHHPLGPVDTMSWECVRTYAPDGRPTGATLSLSDADGRAWMEIEFDAGGRRHHVTKYDWESSDDLRFVFEYTASGAGPQVTDLDEGGWSVRFEDVRDDLVDADFFATADALPRAIAGSALPDCPPAD
jgi:hypothetical protein